MKEKGKNLKLWLIALGGVLIILFLTWLLVVRLEGEKPSIVLDLKSPYLSAAQKLSVTVSDEKTGLRRIWVGLVKDSREVVLLEKDLPSRGLKGGQVHSETFNIDVEPQKLGLTDGKAILRMVARDYSWRGSGHGNRTYIEKDVTIDTKPPGIEILTHVHNVNQGGSGLVIFRLSEPCPEKGVYVGDSFFPGYSGYFKDPNIILTFFALNYDQGPGTTIFAGASDLAGNKIIAGFPNYLKPKIFDKEMIALSDQFLNWKMPEFDADTHPGPDASMVDKFLKVNKDLRQANYQQISVVTDKSAGEMYWKDVFLSLPNGEKKAGFADHRKYAYKGPVIDEQVHLGIDLASIAHSPVPSANAGKVVFEGMVGIYGNTIIVDHGFGLFSMYAHLSSFDVPEGKMVEKGEILGRTGETGLAAGDHLHFSMLVHNTFVNPIEWWDAAWIKNNITSKIEAVGSLK